MKVASLSSGSNFSQRFLHPPGIFEFVQVTALQAILYRIRTLRRHLEYEEYVRRAEPGILYLTCTDWRRYRDAVFRDCARIHGNAPGPQDNS